MKLLKVESSDTIISFSDQILLTGAAGFVGLRVLLVLLQMGYRNIRCFVRPTSDVSGIEALIREYKGKADIEIFRGNLLSRDDCTKAVKDGKVIYHLAVGAGGRSFPDAYLNAVVTTRNLVEAGLAQKCLRRFVNVSSFAVYTNRDKRNRVLDETCPVEQRPESRDAYCFAKAKQDELVMDYSKRSGLPVVTVRPGVVYGPGKNAITGRVGIGTFGFFLHLGGGNKVPLTYVDNCAEAIALAGIKPGVEGEVFNIVDDDLPSSRKFLRSYKRRVRRFKSVYLPKPASYLFCALWESLSNWSEGQVPPFLNRRVWHAHWKGAIYSNEKLKKRLGWRPRVSTAEGLERFFASCRNGEAHA